MITRTYKICPRCKMNKPRAEYYNNKAQSDGLDTCCKSCHELYRPNANEQHRLWYQNNKEKQSQWAKNWRENNPYKIKAHNTLTNSGKMPRQKCSIEGCNNIGERHHEQYDNPFIFIWLCHKHHIQHHKQLEKGVLVTV